MHQFGDSRIVRRHAAATAIAKPIEFSRAALDYCEVCAVCYQQVVFCSSRMFISNAPFSHSSGQTGAMRSSYELLGEFAALHGCPGLLRLWPSRSARTELDRVDQNNILVSRWPNRAREGGACK